MEEVKRICYATFRKKVKNMCEVKRKNNKSNHNRIRILTENLLQYIDKIKVSERNKQIVRSYAEGTGYRELAEKYGITDSRVAQIVYNYIRHCSIYKKETSCYKKTQGIVIEE